MSRRMTTLVALAGIIAVLATAQLAPAWTRKAGLDVWSLSAMKDAWRAEEEQGQELNGMLRDARERGRMTDQVIALLISGELSLSDATEELESLNRDRPCVLAQVGT